MSKPKYILESRIGETYYILQVSEYGTNEALFKAYADYTNNTFTLYPDKLYIRGAEGFTKKVVDFKHVKRKEAE